MKIITKAAKVYNADGYLTAACVEVWDHGETISIDGVEHLKEDIKISETRYETRIESIHGWEVRI